MAKPEWGTKRTCPKCGERFYDLGNDDPVVCLACEEEFKPEPILKTKQPIVAVEKEEEKPEADTDDDDDLDLDDDDEAIGDVSLDDDDDEEVSSIVDTSLASDDS